MIYGLAAVARNFRLCPNRKATQLAFSDGSRALDVDQYMMIVMNDLFSSVWTITSKDLNPSGMFASPGVRQLLCGATSMDLVTQPGVVMPGDMALCRARQTPKNFPSIHNLVSFVPGFSRYASGTRTESG
jgi:hypothetical protein